MLAQLVIAIQPNIQPTLQFVRVTPPSGPLPSGSSFLVNVVPAGNGGLFQLGATVSGAVNGIYSTLDTNLAVQAFIPSTTVPGQQVSIAAQAADGLGQSTGPQVLTLPISDGTPPSLTVVSPLDQAQVVPNQPLSITVIVADNSSNVTLGLSVTGAVTSVQSVPVTLTPNTLTTNILIVPIPIEPTNGGPIVAIVTATDAASNITSITRVFWLPGTQTTVTWDRQALGQTLLCTNGSGSYVWPNNNNWSQSAIFGDPCGIGANVEIAPSNWSTTNYPNATNLDVVLGSLGGAPANLDVSVSIHSLTIQTD